MCNLGIFTTRPYSSPGRLRAQGILRNLPNMYDGLFSTEHCVTLAFSEVEAYSEPCEIFMTKNFIHNLVWPQHFQNRGIFKIQGIFRILPNIYHEIFYSKPCLTWHIQKPSLFRTLIYSEIKAYSEPCRISKMEHFIKNPV